MRDPDLRDDSSLVLRWYLIRTKPWSEAVAQMNLVRQGYEVYVPRALQPMRRAGRWTNRIVPLFPSYLFLHLREGMQSLAPARSSVGVAEVVQFGSRYAIVPDDVIDELRSRADPGSGLHRLTPRRQLRPGTSVSIVAGPLEGLEGIFQRPSGRERVLVLLKLLGQIAAVRMPASFVLARRFA